MSDTPAADRLRRIAERIASNLFVNGHGQRADRLVLMVDGPQRYDLGGWAERVVVDEIERMLRAELEGVLK